MTHDENGVLGAFPWWNDAREATVVLSQHHEDYRFREMIANDETEQFVAAEDLIRIRVYAADGNGQVWTISTAVRAPSSDLGEPIFKTTDHENPNSMTDVDRSVMMAISVSRSEARYSTTPIYSKDVARFDGRRRLPEAARTDSYR